MPSFDRESFLRDHADKHRGILMAAGEHGCIREVDETSEVYVARCARAVDEQANALALADLPVAAHQWEASEAGRLREEKRP